jgi:hypothetical protein
MRRVERRVQFAPSRFRLTQYTLSGQKAVVLNDLTICGGRCLRGANYSNRNSYDISIYVRSRGSCRKVFNERAQGDTLLSLDSDLLDSNNDRFRMLAIHLQRQQAVSRQGEGSHGLEAILRRPGDLGRSRGGNVQD